MRLLATIRYGTERYPEKVARRLRALNLAAWMASAVSASFAFVQLLGATPGLRKVAIINALSTPIFAMIPQLHRFGALAAPATFAAVAYIYVFVVISLLGTATGTQLY